MTQGISDHCQLSTIKILKDTFLRIWCSHWDVLLNPIHCFLFTGGLVLVFYRESMEPCTTWDMWTHFSHVVFSYEFFSTLLTPKIDFKVITTVSSPLSTVIQVIMTNSVLPRNFLRPIRSSQVINMYLKMAYIVKKS